MTELITCKITANNWLTKQLLKLCNYTLMQVAEKIDKPFTPINKSYKTQVFSLLCYIAEEPGMTEKDINPDKVKYTGELLRELLDRGYITRTIQYNADTKRTNYYYFITNAGSEEYHKI